MLEIQGIDMAHRLRNYRRKDIKPAKTCNNLSDMKLLSLSNIFPIDKSNSKFCITKLFEEDDSKRRIHEGILHRRSSIEVQRTDGDFDLTSDIDEMIKSCCIYFKKCNYTIEGNSETSFIGKYLLPFFDVVYLKNSKNRVDSCEESGLCPDWKLGLNVKVKRPGQISIYQQESEYVKIMKEMKGSIDEQIDFGVDKPTSFGLLVEGYKCSLYMMEIKGDGIYISVMIKRFWLVEEVENAVNIPAIVDSLLFVKEKISELEEKMKNRSKEKPLEKFKKESCITKFDKIK